MPHEQECWAIQTRNILENILIFRSILDKAPQSMGYADYGITFPIVHDYLVVYRSKPDELMFFTEDRNNFDTVFGRKVHITNMSFDEFLNIMKDKN